MMNQSPLRHTTNSVRSSTRTTTTTSSTNGSTSSSIVPVVATAAVVVVSTAAVAFYYRRYYLPTNEQQQEEEKEDGTNHTGTTAIIPTAVVSDDCQVNENETTTNSTYHNNENENTDAVAPILMIDIKSMIDDTREEQQEQQQRRILSHNTITIVHGSMTGTCLQLAQQLYHEIQMSISSSMSSSSTTSTSTSEIRHVQMGCIQDYDWWDELINDENENDVSNDIVRQQRQPATLIVLVPTYTNGTFPPNATALEDAMNELQNDWRISNQCLQNKLQLAVFGTGSSEYNETDNDDTTIINNKNDKNNSTDAPSVVPNQGKKNMTITTNNMGQPAKITTRAFHKLGAKIMTKLMIGDDAVGDHIDTSFQLWKQNVIQELCLVESTLLSTTASVQSSQFHSKKYIKQQLQLQRPNKKFSTLPMTTTTTAPANHNNNNNNIATATAATTTSACCQNDTTTAMSNNNNCCQSNHPVVGATAVESNQSDVGCNCSTSTTTQDNASSTTIEMKSNDNVDRNNNNNDMVMMNDDNYDDDFEEEEEDDDDDDEDDDNNATEPDVMDLEDIGDALVQQQKPGSSNNNEPQEMVTAKQAIALKKEGYKLIGTHSAVKLCRWTKHQLRGRGGCYKHTFYGITSYQCMEATPSLACANKCVFCWRHHKNPVGKEWRWKTDDPYYIVDEAVLTHIHMIKETRGIPGVQLDRWKEAHTVKHCALSLVGEPIMYPRIDELLGELHRRQISTFLVTNGQHPTAIGSIRPITQLYVSVDAPTETSLIAIDRPLFQDAWDRLRLSLSSLKDKGQRTVARLTVVKGWNSDEISGYAELIALGQVSLVEVKGVTFCGKSDASNLNMTNTPWHHEVVELTRTLKDELNKMRLNVDPDIPEYDLACEHKHSCSVLLARVDQFATDGYDPVTGQRKWRTWIDYDKFHLLASKHQADPTCTFSVVDYTAPTPDWAIFGAKEEGFDPTDRRHRKQTKHPKYTKYDDDGIPTHDENHQELDMTERQRLRSMMEVKKRQIGDGSTVTELRGGEKEVLDARLMFRGLVVAK